MRRLPLSDAEKIAAALAARLPGWSSQTAADCVATPVTGGLTNVLTKVELTGAATKVVNSPSKRSKRHEEAVIALIREYGSATSSFMNRAQEEKVVHVLSARGLAPTVYASHDWGRVERFVPRARPLTTKEFASSSFVPKVGELLGRYHALSTELFPLCSSPGTSSLFENRLLAWLDVASRTRFSDEINRRRLHALGVDLLGPEISWLVHDALAKVASPVVFAHADVQEGNVLLDDQGGLHLIDFEYAERMERAFDLGNAFCEMSMTYAVNLPPGFALNPDDYPSREVQRDFFKAYCKGAGIKPTDEVLAKLQREADVGALSSHLHWGIWGVSMASQHTGSFDYLEYSSQRLFQYRRLKLEHIANCAVA